MATFIVYTLMAVFLLPLIQIYTGGIRDAEYTNAPLVFLFVLMNLLACGKLPVNHVLEYAGKFKETRSHAIVEMTVNIAVSVAAILKWGICGAVFGTVAALIYRAVMMIAYANRRVLNRSVWQTYRLWVINGAVFAFVMLLFFVDHFSGVSFGKLVVSGLCHSVWIAGLYIAVNFVFARQAFYDMIRLIRRKEAL